MKEVCLTCDLVDLLVLINRSDKGEYELTVEDLEKIQEFLEFPDLPIKVRSVFEDCISFCSDADYQKLVG